MGSSRGEPPLVLGFLSQLRHQPKRRWENLRPAYSGRLLIVGGFFLLAAFGLWSRLLFVQIFRHAYYTDIANGQQIGHNAISPRRGRVFDRSGEGLAVSSFMDSVYLNSRKIPPELDRAVAERMSEIFDVTRETIERRLELGAVRTLARSVPTAKTLSLTGIKRDLNLRDTAVYVEPADDEDVVPGAMGETVLINARLIPIKSEEKVAKALAKALEIATTQALRQMRRHTTPVVYRKVPLAKVNEARRQLEDMGGLPRDALFCLKESKRFYPHGSLAAHVLGYATTDERSFGDNNGVDGVESIYDQFLHGNVARFTALRNARYRRIEPIGDEEYFSAFGHDLHLTIDSEIQRVAERDLARAVQEQRASGGAVVAMDCRSGAVLALANYPFYDPNRFGDAPNFLRSNAAVENILETGSVMKTFLAATLLHLELLDVDTVIDCEGGRAIINGRPVRDAPGHVLYEAEFREVYRYSSNVGCVKAAQLVDPLVYCEYLRLFGFGGKTGIDLPRESTGIFPRQWTWATRDSTAMGYSIGVTPIQVATALCVIANHGVPVKPHIASELRDYHGRLVKQLTPEVGERVISSLAAKKTLELMGEVVDIGTGRKAKVEGYRIGGKTGTSLKVDPITGKYYEDVYFGSFGCIAPVDDPRVVIYCCIDEPQRKHYGGDVAAPVARTVAKAALSVLGVLPTTITDEPAPDPELIADQMRRRPETPIGNTTTETRRGRMPDVTGMTMTEVKDTLRDLSIDVRFEGSGRAIAQTPGVDTELFGVRTAIVMFAREAPTRSDSVEATP